jgi:hypothetical protein
MRSAKVGDKLDVEISAEYPGERGKLCDALLEVGFLDINSDGDTYFIHDFLEHAPRYVRDAVSKKLRHDDEKGAQVRGKVEKSTQQGAQSQQKVEKMTPQRTKEKEKEEEEEEEELKEELKEELREEIPPTHFCEPKPATAHRDELKDQNAAKRIVEAYRSQVGTNGTASGGREAVLRAMDDLPTATEADFLRVVYAYAAECDSQGTERKFRIGAQRFFDGEWREYLSREPRSPQQKAITMESVAEINRREAEVIERLMS